MCGQHSNRQVKTVHVMVKECEKLFDKVLVVLQNIIAFNFAFNLVIFTFTCNNFRSPLFGVCSSIFGIQCAIFCSLGDFLAGASNTLQRDLVCNTCLIDKKQRKDKNVHLKKESQKMYWSLKVMLASESIFSILTFVLYFPKCSLIKKIEKSIYIYIYTQYKYLKMTDHKARRVFWRISGICP